MKGHFYRRGCTCKKKNCSCGSKWAFVVDIGIDPETGKRKQKSKSGFPTKKEAEVAAATLIHELEQGIYIDESCQTFSDFSNEWLPIYSEAKDVKPGTIRVRLHDKRRTYLVFKNSYGTWIGTRLLGISHSFLFYSGIRAGELIALKWKDIDFVNHTISITKRATIQATMRLNINWVLQRQENHEGKLLWMRMSSRR